MEVQTQSVESVASVVTETKVTTETPAPVVAPAEAKPDASAALEGLEVAVEEPAAVEQLASTSWRDNVAIGVFAVLILSMAAFIFKKMRSLSK